MLNSSYQQSHNQESEENTSYISPPPTVSLPKGGGAITGMGEKFSMNPVTGTGSLSIPIYVSPGRSGFSPQLSLNYDSGRGNGSFGLGQNLGVPSIERKTQKGLPQYKDADDSDIFLLSGAEDLVPKLKEDDLKNYDVRPVNVPDDILSQHLSSYPETGNYFIKQYRPRIEGLFARIERWEHQDTGDIHWRSLTKDNITSVYGNDLSSRVVDPEDSTRIFEWLLCESYDDKGNVIVYQYKQEDTENVDATLPQERNRLADGHSYTQQYLKRVFYGNQRPFERDNWLFQVVFDYGEHDIVNPLPDEEVQSWLYRRDAFSNFRSGFEIRTQRLCQRVLMFHRFDETGQIDATDKSWYLVRSTDLGYEEDPVATYLINATQTGYRWDENAQEYHQKSYPPLKLSYDRPELKDEIQSIDSESLENLPVGLDGSQYQWLDLDGEGISGILTEQAGGWFYKANLGTAKFAPLQTVVTKPSLSNPSNSQHRFMDLAGDGQQDLVLLNREHPGFYERNLDEEWSFFKAFRTILNVDWNDPNLRMIDLNGDGHADILISEQDVFVWYPSQAEAGFGQSERVHKLFDEEKSPAVIFADIEQTIYLADMTGDGLNDIVRIRNGEVCYWANMGYGKFSSKVTMGNAPYFDHPELFNQRQIRLADIDGSGTTDLIYLRREGVRIWFNQAGNSWSNLHQLRSFPPVDNLTSVQTVDLFGNGTACLVWSSPLPGATHQPMQYIDLMGGQKPHLLRSIQNNMGAETKLYYATSTKFYLEDKARGKPWITKIPFPVQVVERVETIDHISGNKFVSSYRYKHGYFDGEEREFRGFGYVEQLDTEAFEVFQGNDVTNATDESLHIPPILTKTWFHTGFYLDRDRISKLFAEEYYQGDADAVLLSDTMLPEGLTVNITVTEADGNEQIKTIIQPYKLTAKEEHEACRALKGSVLRQEVYALDETDKSENDKSEHPYTVTESNYEIRQLQPRHGEQYGVFFIHPRESLAYHYERSFVPDPTDPERKIFDPRVAHQLTLEVDGFGNVLKSVAIAYPRRTPAYPEQGQTLITYSENRVTNEPDRENWYRLGVPIETKTYEISGLSSEFPWQLEDIRQLIQELFDNSETKLDYESFPDGTFQRRLIEQARTFYRADSQANSLDPDRLPLGDIDSLALPAESFKLAFTPGLLNQIYGSKVSTSELNDLLASEGGYFEQDGLWWIPSGRQNFESDKFYLTTQMRDPFGGIYLMEYDRYSLLVEETRDPLPAPQTNIVQIKNDYRSLKPKELTDPNDNRSQVAFDTLGMVVGTVVMGKKGQNQGDSLEEFQVDLSQEERDRFFDDPVNQATNLLGTATSRIVYDLDRYRTSGEPVLAATLSRETHVYAEEEGNDLKIQKSIIYSDGFGRELQTKVQVEPGEALQRDASGELRLNADGEMILADTEIRWVGSGRTIYNNKGKPVKQYEPFFSSTHHYENELELVEYGVTPIIFYDPLERVIATLHPNHTYDKVVFDPWRQETWDVNDTLTELTRSDFKADPDVGGYFQGLDDTDYLPTWFTRYNSGTSAEQDAANKAASHAETQSVVHLDTLGRPFLTIADNGIAEDGTPQLYETRVAQDIEGQQLYILDARQNAVMVYATVSKDSEGRLIKDSAGKPVLGVRAYDLLGNNLYSYSMDAGERWMLNNVAGNPIRVWDVNNRITIAGEEVLENRQFRTIYDPLQRPLEQRLSINGGLELTIERFIYGEGQPNDRERNLKGQLYQHFDPSGLMTNDLYDFKGNLLKAQRQLTNQYRASVLNWSGVAPETVLESEIFTQRTQYDALNRIKRLLNWYSDPNRVAVYEPYYNQRGVLQAENLTVNAQREDGDDDSDSYTGGTSTRAIIDITYNPKGQRESIHYGNNTITRYDYNPLTFRLKQLRTTRPSYNPPFPRYRSNLRDERVLQQLSYTYDPVGNITEIYDEAYEPVFFVNQRVEPRSRYTYDAIYRLIEATGRENITNNEAPRQKETDFPAANFPRTDQALRNYTQSYAYDKVGNIELMHHGAVLGSSIEEIWTRNYRYAEDSNRLLRTWKGRNELEAVNYEYDIHGSMLNLNRSPDEYRLRWDYRDMIHAANLGGGGWAYYNYDAGKQRTRKVITNQAGEKQWERIYLGGMEVYRRYGVTGIVEEIETHHLFADDQRVLIVEDVLSTSNSNLSIGTLYRYQYGNHLGSVSLEMTGDDTNPEIISYEEYHPYGTSAYRAMNRNVRAVAKRYRYTGMERDEETGLSYHTARFYMPWLGRWCSTDPIGIKDNICLYSYAQNRPSSYIDKNGRQSQASEEDDDINTTSSTERSGAEEQESTPIDASTLDDKPTLNEFLQVNNAIDQNREELTKIWRELHPRGVRLFTEGVFGTAFDHAYLVITTDTEELLVELQGPRDDETGFPFVEQFWGHEGRKWVDEESNNITRPSSSEEDALFEERIIEFARFFQEKDPSGKFVHLPEYSSTGPNSNGFVRALVELAGGEINLSGLGHSDIAFYESQLEARFGPLENSQERARRRARERGDEGEAPTMAPNREQIRRLIQRSGRR